MVLKRHISYKWRLFIPIVVMMWVIILGLAWWQTERETEARRGLVNTHLKLVTSRILYSADANRADLISSFLEFADRYYKNSPLFGNLRVSLYDSEWNLKDYQGEPIRLTDEEEFKLENETFEREALADGFGGQRFFYIKEKSKDGAVIAIAALPVDDNLEDYLMGDKYEIWAIVILLATIMTIVIYLSARYLSRNISLLKEFSRRITTDASFEPGQDFPHDELGDVAREIVSLYNERTIANQKVEHEHKVALHAIEEKALAKRQITNNINHELKTPIGVIKGYLDTLIESPDLDEEMRIHFTKKAREHANRLVSLINDVSAITRLEEGSSMINTERTNYHDLVYTFANDISESGALGHMEFIFDIPFDIVIKGNGYLLTGMLANLARNSANYSCGTTCTLEFCGETQNGFYQFSFYDDGVGVPEDALPHLFDRFYRIDSGRARKTGGTGLGLAIVNNTITAHGGTIIGRNHPEGGLEIFFTLPKWRGH